IVVMAIGASEVELALTLHEEFATFLDERLQFGIVARIDRHAARLIGDEGCEREQVAAFIGKRRRLLMPCAFQIDALLDRDRAAERLVKGGIAHCHALHALPPVAMAVGAGLLGVTGLLVPERFAVEHEQHAGIGGVVVLHRAGIRPHEGIAGAALLPRYFSGTEAGCRGEQRGRHYRARPVHSTLIEAEAVDAKPLSPIHSNSNLPLSFATVKKDRNGLAAIAGKKSARKISVPL